MKKIAAIDINAIPILNDNYVWVISIHEDALIVDPGEADPVNDFLLKKKLQLKGILITHHHWDHTNGIDKIKIQFDVPVFGPAKKMKNVTIPLDDKNDVKINHFPLQFQIIHIPGHTLDHIAYYVDHMLFCGDTLFAAGCGRAFEGTYHELYQSLKKIVALPDETNIYCAHEYTLKNLSFAEMVEPNNPHIVKRIEYVSEVRKQNLPSLPSSLKEEKLTNPFLRCDSLEIVRNVEQYAGKKLNNSVEVFTWLRKWKDEF